MKEVELRLVAELIRNSRRSDRELSKALGVSQPTVSRMIKKLEKEGVIKEYTMIPDFPKLGFTIMSASFMKLNDSAIELSDELKKYADDFQERSPYPVLSAVLGSGTKHDRMFITFYEDYAAYSNAMRLAKQLPDVDVETLESFLVDLCNPQYRILSMSAISDYILSQAEKTGKSGRGKKPVARGKNTKKSMTRQT